jgi:rhodanese-related sulfurtransferase/glyoxylase-like metal-dependent hydrolase (beta-lactamase superfamily II)
MTILTYSELLLFCETNPHHTLLDCRTLEYWLWESIPNSKNIRLKELPEKAATHLPDKDSPVIVFADAQGTELAKIGSDLLNELGYTSVYYFEGGIDMWKQNSGAPFRSKFRIAERAMRLPSQRFYGEEVGSYLVNADDYLILVDGPLTLSESNEDFILSFNKPIRILLTHGGAGGGTSEILRSMYQAEIFLHAADRDSEWLTCEPTTLFDNEFEIAESLTIITTPGVSPGSTTLFDAKDGVLYCGGLLAAQASNELHIPESQEVDTNTVIKSLEKLQFLPTVTVAPFRGPVVHKGTFGCSHSELSLIQKVLHKNSEQKRD